eukprot:TRINITY_DN65739_c6_g6_i1.p1 TRINITY_DN65739_c6_g6~~TRINITY_DN65739_c6_g6_i1.p1  ORF type:complete len:593 (+),score=264.62 TRINITY_DN65739_c6_g6_i1:130-1908(+)
MFASVLPRLLGCDLSAPDANSSTIAMPYCLPWSKRSAKNSACAARMRTGPFASARRSTRSGTMAGSMRFISRSGQRRARSCSRPTVTWRTCATLSPSTAATSGRMRSATSAMSSSSTFPSAASSSSSLPSSSCSWLTSTKPNSSSTSSGRRSTVMTILMHVSTDTSRTLKLSSSKPLSSTFSTSSNTRLCRRAHSHSTSAESTVMRPWRSDHMLDSARISSRSTRSNSSSSAYWNEKAYARAHATRTASLGAFSSGCVASRTAAMMGADTRWPTFLFCRMPAMAMAMAGILQNKKVGQRVSAPIMAAVREATQPLLNAPKDAVRVACARAYAFSFQYADDDELERVLRDEILAESSMWSERHGRITVLSALVECEWARLQSLVFEDVLKVLLNGLLDDNFNVREVSVETCIKMVITVLRLPEEVEDEFGFVLVNHEQDDDGKDDEDDAADGKVDDEDMALVADRILPEVAAVLGDNVAQVRQVTVGLLHDLARRCPERLMKRMLPAIVPDLVERLADANGPVRILAAQALFFALRFDHGKQYGMAIVDELASGALKSHPSNLGKTLANIVRKNVSKLQGLSRARRHQHNPRS